MVTLARSRTASTAGVALVAAVVASVLILTGSARAAVTRAAGPLVPGQGAMFGAYVDPDGVWSGNATQESEITSFESSIGRRLDIVQHYYSWTTAFPSGLEQWDLAGGRIPLVSWHGASLDAINAGTYDSMIRARADGLKALGRPVFLRWCWEMNGNWFECDGTHNNSSGMTDGPAKFVAAWRHIHDIFTAEGATNVVWVWSPNAQDVPNQPWNHYTNYYPGDAYVDWVGIDGYNWGTTKSWSSWTSFSSIFSGVYNTYASRKPLMIVETSSAEQGGNKAQWISDARQAVKSQFPGIAAFLWFDVLKEADWRANSTSTAMSAYTGMADDPYFTEDSMPAPTPSPSPSAAPSPSSSPSSSPPPSPSPSPSSTSPSPSPTNPPPSPPPPLAITGLSASPQVATKSTTISFLLNEGAAITIQLTDASGTVVRQLRTGVTYPAGTSAIRWDLKNDSHRLVPSGPYTVVVIGSAAGNTSTVTTTVQVA